MAIFTDSNTQRFTISYFNRRSIGLVNNFTANRTTTSASYVELNSEIRCEFLTWADEAVLVIINGGSATSAAGSSEHSIGFDGTTAENAYSRADNTTTQAVAVALVRNGLSEGFHFVTHLGRIAGGNTQTVIGGVAGAGTALTVRIRG